MFLIYKYNVDCATEY